MIAPRGFVAHGGSPGESRAAPARQALPAASVAGAIYLLAALVLTYPLCVRLATAVVHDPGDPLLNTWLLWWNAHHLPLTAGWWNGPIFFPTPDTLAFSETLAGLSPLSTPIIWVTGNPLLAYNLVLLLSFPASALAAWWLCWTLTARADAALLAGLAFGFAPYRLDQLPHIQILATWWMPLALGAAHRYLEDGARRWLVLLGVSWMLLGATNGYVLLFFAVVFAAWLAWFASRATLSRTIALTAAWMAGLLPVVPILLRYRSVHRTFDFERPYQEMIAYSADLLSLARGADLLALGHRWLLPQGTENNLFPGVVVGVGVPVGLAYLAWRGRRAPAGTWPEPVTDPAPAFAAAPARQSALDARARGTDPGATLHPWLRAVFGIAVATAVALSAVPVSIALLGPWRVEWGPVVVSALGGPRAAGAALAAWLAAAVLSPPVQRLWRAHSALGFYGLSTLLVWLLALGPEIHWQGSALVVRAPYYWLLRLPGFEGLRAPGRFAFLATLTLAVCGGLLVARLLPLRATLRWGIIGLLGLGIVADTWPSSIPLLGPPRQFQLLQTSAQGPLVELPLGHAERDIAAMYRQMFHGQPIVNGFSGYLAPHYDILEIALEEDRDHEALAQLAARGVKYVVVDQRSDPDGVREQFAASAPFAHFVARQAGHVLFSLSAPLSTPSAAAIEPTARVPMARVVDERGQPVGMDALIDGNPLTAWQSPAPQTGHETLTFSLDQPTRLSVLEITHGPYRGGFARRLVVETSSDGDEWVEHFSGRLLPLLVGGVMDDPRLGRVRIDVHGVTARHLRLRQTGQTTRSTWAIADLDLYRAP